MEQKKYFITKKFFRKPFDKQKSLITQWWIYILNKDGLYEPLIGTYEKKYKDAKKILLEELTK